MPSTNAEPRAFKKNFSAAFTIAMLLIPAAFAADGKDKDKDKDKDQQAYCEYITQQAAAQRDLLLAPNAVAGITQPNTGLPTQLVWGVSGSLSSMRKAGLTMDAARKNCELYSASTQLSRTSNMPCRV